MKRRLLVITAALISVITVCAVFSSAATVSDPADNYVVQTAENEDSSISMWFEHSFKKVMTSDVTHSGMDTYSVYMAKNEIESAQFILYSDTTHTKMNASVTNFTDADGNTLEAEVYYQMYVTLNELASTAYLGATAEDSFIREGEQPEALVPLSAVSGGFKLNAGKSQAFYIRVKSTSESKSGWYSAQLNITNSEGQVVKTATVYAYVWNFEISEKTALQTSFYLDNSYLISNNITYKDAYDYLLENRMNAMDIPGAFSSENEYLTNDRVAAIRVSPGVSTTLGNAYLNQMGAFESYKALYDDVSNMAEWDDIKDKFYFYVVDEAMSAEQQDAIGKGGATVEDVKRRYAALDVYWPGANTVLPYHENHPYPYYTFSTPIASITDTATFKDGLQEMMETDTVQIWCPQYYAFTPQSVLDTVNYQGLTAGYTPVRNLSGTISGNILYGEGYYNWEKLYGEFADRVISDNMVKNAKEGRETNQRLWTYSAGWNKSYTYCNHLIESTGLQTKMLFWQLYQNDITGYLYYGTNNWNEYDYQNNTYVDTTTTGAKKGSFKVNKHVYSAANSEGAHSIFGNGVLFYAANMAKVKADNTEYGLAGTIRIEQIRDGIEEYQMLTMLEELKGSSAADAMVANVSDNNACYLSLPGFDRSAYAADMDDYDVMAAVRIELGNEIEAANKSKCKHEYDDGKVTKEATCLEMGEMTYTCTKCGATDVENIPTLHAQGDCFERTGGVSANCYNDGRDILKCTICGYSKYVVTKAYHSDDSYLVYISNGDNNHYAQCTVCEETLEPVAHDFFTVYSNSCTEAGTADQVCRDCGHTVVGEAVEAHGHHWRDGVCTVCGEKDPDYVEPTPDEPDEPDVPEVTPGDLNADGKVNLADVFIMKGIIAGSVTPTEEQMLAGDLNADSKINLADIYLLKVLVIA